MEEDKKNQEIANSETQSTFNTKETLEDSSKNEVDKDFGTETLLESEDSLEDYNAVIVPNKFISVTHCDYGDIFSTFNKKVVKGLDDKEALQKQLVLFKFDLDNFISSTVAQLKGQCPQDATLECGWFAAFMHDHFYMERFSKNETFSYEEIVSANDIAKNKIENVLNYSEVLTYVESF